MAKSRLIKFVLIAGAALLVFLPPFAKYQELQYKNRMLEEEIKETKRETKRLEEEKRRLLTDMAYIEKRARDKIGVVRNGEIVIKTLPRKQK
jgi:cell division protein FtsB